MGRIFFVVGAFVRIGVGITIFILNFFGVGICVFVRGFVGIVIGNNVVVLGGIFDADIVFDIADESFIAGFVRIALSVKFALFSALIGILIFGVGFIVSNFFRIVDIVVVVLVGIFYADIVFDIAD